MITCFIYRESAGHKLEKVDSVEVADNAPDPETAAWTAWTRNASRDAGNYIVARRGKRFTATSKRSMSYTVAGQQ